MPSSECFIANVYKKHCHQRRSGDLQLRCQKLHKRSSNLHKAETLLDKKNKLMRIDELYKFSDGTLNDVRTALDDILKRIRMKYLPQTYWKKVDKDRAEAMIQAIDKMLKNKHAEFDESNANVLERFYTSAGNPVKEILLKLNLPDHRILKDGGEERYEHVGPNVASLQDGETRLCLVDNLKVFKITISHSRQDKGTSSSLKSMITTSNHKLMIEVKDYELKTKVEA
ncbi:hypothetical protein Tco_0210975 [Tanacetum coccineum]